MVNGMTIKKRGWIRILEAVLAIILVSSVLIYVVVKNQVNVQNEKLAERVANLQDNVLDGIAQSSTLRNATLNSNFSLLEEYVISQLDGSFNYSLGICEIRAPVCPPQSPYRESQITTTSDLFVDERIISSTLDNYNPKILRLYIWPVQ